MTMQRPTRVSQLDDKEVVTEGGNILGSVKDWEFDPDTWKLTGVVVKVRRDMLEELGLKKPLIGTQEIVVATAHISGIANRVVLNKKLDQFAKHVTAEVDGEVDEEKPSEDA